MTGDRAAALIAAGRTAEAIALVRAAAGGGDGEALFTLAVWHLTGQPLVRDLAASRELFRQAARAGEARAGAVYTNFAGNGTGGPREWDRALGLLRQRAADDPSARRQHALIAAMTLTGDGEPAAVPRGQPLCETPAITRFPALLSADECAYLIDTAMPLLAPSVVVDPRSGRQVPDPVRTSDGAAFPYVSEDPAIHALNRRLAAATGTDVRQGEPLQVLRYRPGQEYRTHHDAFAGADNQRVLTVLVWLNDDYDGGETFFPGPRLSLRGRAGDAVAFANADAAGRLDPAARHAGLPVTRGVKLLASRWIRARPL